MWSDFLQIGFVVAFICIEIQSISLHQITTFIRCSTILSYFFVVEYRNPAHPGIETRVLFRCLSHIRTKRNVKCLVSHNCTRAHTHTYTHTHEHAHISTNHKYWFNCDHLIGLFLVLYLYPERKKNNCQQNSRPLPRKQIVLLIIINVHYYSEMKPIIAVIYFS